MSPNFGRNAPVKTAGTVFGMIEYLQTSDGAGVTEVARGMGLAKSTAHGHLKTLEEYEYVVNDEGTYRVGLKFLDHAYFATRRLRITDAIHPTLDQLATETGEVAWVVVEEHGKAINLEMAAGEQAVRTVDRVGLRTHLHFHAAGKAILAALPPERVDSIVERHGLPAATENTITDRDTLDAALERIRERGYALNDGEAVDRLRSVAAAIVADERVLGAITVIGPSKRLTGSRFHEELPEVVLGAANAIELNLEYAG